MNDIVIKDTNVAYDALGRMTSFDDAGVIEAMSVDYEYDLNGNIRHTTKGTEVNWSKFDTMNREVTRSGDLVNGVIIRGLSGEDYAYDVAGQKVSTTTTVQRSHQIYVEPSQEGQVIEHWGTWGWGMNEGSWYEMGPGPGMDYSTEEVRRQSPAAIVRRPTSPTTSRATPTPTPATWWNRPGPRRCTTRSAPPRPRCSTATPATPWGF